MAPESYGRAGRAGHPGFANGPANGGPPPSTLAAQLVENVSATAKSSRSDETGELKRLFSVIERVKNQPDLLKTAEERVEHNHMLIYVYARVVLEGLKWDDPFADRAQLRTEALKAINFLRVTIKETPNVLVYCTDGKAFLFRGEEPLWLWLFPKILKMLGHNHCLPLNSALEAFCSFLLTTASFSGGLWQSRESFSQYLQGIFELTVEHLKGIHSTSREAIEVELPSKDLLDRLNPVTPSGTSGCFYNIYNATHAFRHALSLLSIISSVSMPNVKQQTPDCSFTEQIPWLLDSFQLFSEEWRRWQHQLQETPTVILQLLVRVVSSLTDLTGVEKALHQKAHVSMILLCQDVLTQWPEEWEDDETTTAAMETLCLTLVLLSDASIKYKSISRLVASQILPLLERLPPDPELDPQLSLCVYLTSEVATKFTTSKPLSASVQPGKFKHPELQMLVKGIHHRFTPPKTNEPPAKRRKGSAVSTTISSITAPLYQLAGLLSSDSLEDLEGSILNRFSQLKDEDRCLVIDLLARIPCAADNTLASVGSTDPRSTSDLRCSYCSTFEESGNLPTGQELDAKSAAINLFTKLIRQPSFLESRRPRVAAMIGLKRLIAHSKDPELLDLERSSPGQWCLQSLQSSIRELRIAAGRTLAAFIRASIAVATEPDILRRNKANALGILKSISDKDVAHLHETCIMAWGQVGRVVSDEELALVLAKLLDFLGHRNVMVSAFAFNETLNLARFRRTTIRGLFEPFWRSLAYTAVKDMVSRPQTTRLLAELLKMSVNELLLTLQTHALPYLVLTKKREVIQRIADARGEKEPWQPCLDAVNMSSILALLLIQEVPDVENFSLSLLRHVSPHFNSISLMEILTTEPVPTALELLKVGGEVNESRRQFVRAALTMMASMLLNGTRDAKKKSHHVVGRFLQQHALGLTARLVEIINDTINAHPPIQEQRRCIAAMEEMIKIGKSYVRIARPQISACLLSALSCDELRSSAFSCWSALLTYMEDEDVEVLIETTFFIIGHYWNSFDDHTREMSKELIIYLLNNHQTVLEGTVDKLPSLVHINDLAGLETKLKRLRKPLDNRATFNLFAERLAHENSGVVQQALSELSDYLRQNQGYLQASAISEQPDSIVTALYRTLLDCSSKYNGVHADIGRLCAECIGLVGCLDSNRIETVREQKDFVVLHNFDDAAETTDFVLFLLSEVIVKSFLSATDTSVQGFLSYAMQELLDRCDFKVAVAKQGREGEAVYRKWLSLPESTREVLTPFMTSRYRLNPMTHPKMEYPIFRSGKTYGNWLRHLVLDLLQKGQNLFAQIIFEPLCRVIRVKDLSVAEFLLPYLVVHVTIGQDSSPEDRENVLNELLSILKQELPKSASYVEREEMKMFSEAVFRVLDYAMRWLQKKKSLQTRNQRDELQISRVQQILDAIPAIMITHRAIECNQYARALFHLEPWLFRRDEEGLVATEASMYRTAIEALQHIYTQIDEPDGLEGISANLNVIDLNQQILSHRKAGRWTAVQTWYEVRLAEDPENIEVQLGLLACLKESGQYDVLLNYVEGMNTTPATINRIVPFAVEASWATSRWQTLQKYLRSYNAGNHLEIFNLGIGSALLSLKDGKPDQFKDYMRELRDKAASSMSYSATASLQSCHDAMLKCHVLTDLELIADNSSIDNGDQQEIQTHLNRRLEVLGAYVSDKQYLLGIRRAAMELMRPKFSNGDISALWLSSARLARKANSMHQSFNAVLHASQLGDGSATIENARLLWKEGHNRKAIQLLENAIHNNSFIGYNLASEAPTSSKSPESQRNLLTARAHLLLAKWQDSAGQTNANALRMQYQLAARTHAQWEKGHYYLGRHYKKILESEKALRPDEQTDEYLGGEIAKLVIENYMRSLRYGTKYLYQTLPRILTLWLELGAQVDKAPDGKVSLSTELSQRRKTVLRVLHESIKDNIKRLPSYVFYTVLPQIVARIGHPNIEVFGILESIILKVVEAYPRQALWSLCSIMTTKKHSERGTREQQILQKLRYASSKVESGSYELKQLVRMGEKLAHQLLQACNNGDFQSNRTTVASITRDLNFKHNCTPCPLVVPVEACLTATLPTLTDNTKKHKAFSRDVITITSFLDEVLVLGSLAKPRRLTARGSDGKSYNLLIKPKDDLRTDQRLMEFNSMINRSLKRDAESSRRQLYIKTYAVTPLNEECGIIEWVDGLKTLRDILLGIYKTRGIAPNYGQIASMMKEACVSRNYNIFTQDVLRQFPPVLPSWFISQFPNPSAWFAARLKYTRSCAVMSMVGTILGLGDRHGENVLLEEGNGGVFHVDFNCLFDKGKTFAQPEMVPFRLTHNMVQAMGIYGYEGPFRQCSELTLSILRQQEETLMSILEAFIYDPTLDLQRDKKRKSDMVKLSPTSVVETIKRKVRGLPRGESIPLGVEGQVEALIKEATDPKNLAAMYIGWCPFL